MTRYELPELWRATRHLGAPLVDARRQAIHDAWFRPLLDARAAAHAVRDPVRQSAHFAATRLVAAYGEVITDLARQAHPAGGAAMRALEARIEEAAAPVFSALQQLEVAERHVGHQGVDQQSAQAWSIWVAQLRAAIAAIDAVFPDVVHVITT